MVELLDWRLNPYRDDLAAAYLRDKVAAPEYREGVPRQVRVGVAPLLRAPRADARRDSEVLFGETVHVYDERDGWAWLQNDIDGYVGYTPSSALSERITEATHVVAAPRTLLFSEPDIKSTPLDYLSMEARLTLDDEDGDYARTTSGGWVFRRHIAPLGVFAADWTATALRFLEVPYLWGGRSSLGLDCSALIQIALERAGIACPRDSDMQADDPTLGESLARDAAPRRGDLIFWRGHVAIALDHARVVNTTGHHLSTVIEPLADIDARAREESGDGIIAIRRPGA